MNILFIIDQLCVAGGAEKMLWQTIRRLPADRYRCQLLTFKQDPAIQFFQDPPCPVHVFPLRRTYDGNALRVAHRMWKLIRDQRIDLVHTFHETSDLWAAPIARLAGCKFIVSSRRDMGFHREGKHALAYRCISRYFDRVLAVSERVRERSIEVESLRPEKVVTIHNGLDLSVVDGEHTPSQTRQELGVAPEVPLIATVGNIRWIKGTDILIVAAGLVCRHFPDAVFAIAGDVLEADYFAGLMGRIQAAKLETNVRFIGSRRSVFPLLKASTVFCLPSRSEGFSNALIEAMACRLPVVATDVGGNSEAVTHGENGLLAPSEDPEALAAGILTLLRSPALAESMARRARETVEARFTLEKSISALAEVYDTLIPA